MMEKHYFQREIFLTRSDFSGETACGILLYPADPKAIKDKNKVTCEKCLNELAADLS